MKLLTMPECEHCINSSNDFHTLYNIGTRKMGMYRGMRWRPSLGHLNKLKRAPSVGELFFQLKGKSLVTPLTGSVNTERAPSHTFFIQGFITPSFPALKSVIVFVGGGHGLWLVNRMVLKRVAKPGKQAVENRSGVTHLDSHSTYKKRESSIGCTQVTCPDVLMLLYDADENALSRFRRMKETNAKRGAASMEAKDRKASDKKRSLSVKEKKPTKRQSRAEGKAKKDPNQPKRPPTAFFVFLEEFRKSFKEKNPNVKGVTAVSSLDLKPEQACLCKMKVVMNSYSRFKPIVVDIEKAPYIAKAAQKRVEYDRTMIAYKKKKDASEEGGTPEESEKSKSEINDDDDEEESGEDDDEE
eukprot:Gb_07912 [translate_table: standard]